MNPPMVSIVTATYNRSNVLRYAIETVRWQTLEDWELIVIGDACTDDTSAVVESYGDPRIRFFNRDTNFGEQSRPNNDGASRARGRYLAFLNHDDLWFPEHLKVATDQLVRGKHDLVYPLYLSLLPNGSCQLQNVTPESGYLVAFHVPASTWVLRREIVQAVGPWRPYTATYLAPSQDWLHRAFRLGHSIGHVPRVTSLRISSSGRAGSYSQRQDAEHKDYFDRISAPGFLEDALTRSIVDLERWNRRAVAGHFGQAGINMARRACVAVGVAPATLATWLRHRRRGGAIDHYRAVRGLPLLERED